MSQSQNLKFQNRATRPQADTFLHEDADEVPLCEIIAVTDHDRCGEHAVDRGGYRDSLHGVTSETAALAISRLDAPHSSKTMSNIVTRRQFVNQGALGLMSAVLPVGTALTAAAGAPSGDDGEIRSVCESVLAYLLRVQDFKAGEYHGSFWSEKAYHGPLLDYHAGGSHHHRSAGSAALALWLIGQKRNDADLKRRAEAAFDWLAARQRPSGGYLEIQNNEKPSDWERTGLEECSTIETAFVARGLGHALLLGLPPKKLYSDCLQRAGLWQLGIEWPPGSGVFPHHERSPHDTLNANLHAAETLMAAFKTSEIVFQRPVNIFQQGARRGVLHTLTQQAENGSFPYRSTGGSTINYTSLVLWCLLNIHDLLRDPMQPGAGRDLQLDAAAARRIAAFAPPDALRKAFDAATGFLRGCVDADGGLLWEKNETSTARHNLWTYVITYNVLRRIGGERNTEAASRLLKAILGKRTKSGLLPMRDRGEEITECAYMQADMLLFLLPFSRLV